MSKLLGWVIASVIMIVAMTASAHAANPYSAAYSVNDSVISHYDIDQRVKLLRVLGAPSRGIRDGAIEQLIDDRIKIRAARLAGFAIGAEGLAHGLNSIAVSENTTVERMWAKARAAGISRQAYDAFYTSQFAWRELVQRRFQQAADPTSIELDNAINVAASVSHETILLAEIALPFAERGEDATIAFATRLANDLNNGANFADVARQFSRAQTAQNGGVIGWLAPERLPSAVISEVLNLSKGQVSAPIRVPTGLLILKVVDARVVTSGLQKQVSVEYAVLDLSGQTNALAQARRMQNGLDECSPHTSTASAYGPASGLFESTSVDQVPTDIALALARLMPGKSDVIVNGDSVMLVQLCNRTTDLPDEVQAQLTNNLFGQKLSKLAEGYLLELRRTAIIEKR